MDPPRVFTVRVEVHAPVSEKANVKTTSRKLNKKYGKVATIELIERDPFVPAGLEDSLRKSLVKAKTVTPQELARRHGISVSAAKRLLEKLVEEGVVFLAYAKNRLKIYRGTSA
ncbi:MAG: hypothetical protein Kow0069_26920 [Promethearchaeota archaeon]